MLHRGEPLHRAGIGEPEGADRAVGPPLPGGPLDGVVAVLSFLPVGIKHALGAVAAAYVLEQHRISSTYCRTDQWIRGCLDPAVRCAVHQHRKTAGTGGAIEIGP